jgi:hypothetical protein
VQVSWIVPGKVVGYGQHDAPGDRVDAGEVNHKGITNGHVSGSSTKAHAESDSATQFAKKGQFWQAARLESFGNREH